MSCATHHTATTRLRFSVDPDVPQPMYSDRVAIARKRLASGYYDRDDVTDLTIDRIAQEFGLDAAAPRR